MKDPASSDELRAHFLEAGGCLLDPPSGPTQDPYGRRAFRLVKEIPEELTKDETKAHMRVVAEKVLPAYPELVEAEGTARMASYWRSRDVVVLIARRRSYRSTG